MPGFPPMFETVHPLRGPSSPAWAPVSDYHSLRATAHTCNRKGKKENVEYIETRGQIRQMPTTTYAWHNKNRQSKTKYVWINMGVLPARINTVSVQCTQCVLSGEVLSEKHEIQETQRNQTLKPWRQTCWGLQKDLITTFKKNNNNQITLL